MTKKNEQDYTEFDNPIANSFFEYCVLLLVATIATGSLETSSIVTGADIVLDTILKNIKPAKDYNQDYGPLTNLAITCFRSVGK